MRSVNRKKRKLYAVCATIAAVILCVSLLAARLDRTVQLRSDAAGVEFVMEDGIVTCVEVNGSFPYWSVVATQEAEAVKDGAGNIVEEITTYAFEAGLSLSTAQSMKLYIEPPTAAAHTYVLKFADKDVVIRNGRVVE